jgi:hypothetical protein
MKKLSVFVMVSLAAILVLSACSVVGDLTQVKNTGDDFMAALRDGEALTSWDLLSPDLQAEIGDQAAWVDFATPRNFSEWKFTNTQFENDYGQLDGEATLGIETYTIQLILYKISDAWKIAGIDIVFKE